MKRPWGIQAIDDIYQSGVQAGLPGGKWVTAVAVPYHCNVFERVRAAWWVLTGRAVAFVWPRPGDLERTLGHDAKRLDRIERLEKELDEVWDATCMPLPDPGEHSWRAFYDEACTRLTRCANAARRARAALEGK